MRNPPSNNPPYESPTGRQSALRFFFCPVFRAIPLCPCSLPICRRTPPTSSPDPKACIPVAGLPSCHSVFPHRPFLLRSCFRTHLHLVPHPLHSSPSHPSDAHCPPVPLMWAGASAAGLSALPIRLSAPGASACTAPSHSPPVRRAHLHAPISGFCFPVCSPSSASANPRTHKKTADVLDIRCFSVVIQIRIRRAASRIQSGRT